MTTSSPTDRFVFDAYAEQAVTIHSAEALPTKCVLVTDDCLANEAVGGSSMPQTDDYVTVAGPGGVVRGKMIGLAYVIEIERGAAA